MNPGEWLPVTEIERIGESQRFMTRVIADRTKVPASRTGRVITPH